MIVKIIKSDVPAVIYVEANDFRDWNFGDPTGQLNDVSGYSATHICDKSGTFTISSVNMLGGKETSTITILPTDVSRPHIYIDNISGNDANDGTTWTKPIQSISKLVTLLKPHCQILFACTSGTSIRSWQVSSNIVLPEDAVVRAYNPTTGTVLLPLANGSPSGMPTDPILICTNSLTWGALFSSGAAGSVFIERIIPDQSITTPYTQTWRMMLSQTGMFLDSVDRLNVIRDCLVRRSGNLTSSDGGCPAHLQNIVTEETYSLDNYLFWTGNSPNAANVDKWRPTPYAGIAGCVIRKTSRNAIGRGIANRQTFVKNTLENFNSVIQNPNDAAQNCIRLLGGKFCTVDSNFLRGYTRISENVSAYDTPWVGQPRIGCQDVVFSRNELRDFAVEVGDAGARINIIDNEFVQRSGSGISIDPRYWSKPGGTLLDTSNLTDVTIAGNSYRCLGNGNGQWGSTGDFVQIGPADSNIPQNLGRPKNISISGNKGDWHRGDSKSGKSYVVRMFGSDWTPISNCSNNEWTIQTNKPIAHLGTSDVMTAEWKSLHPTDNVVVK